MIYSTKERAEAVAALLNGAWNPLDGTTARAIKTADGWTVSSKTVWA
jgi:hypothetical protein